MEEDWKERFRVESRLHLLQTPSWITVPVSGTELGSENYSWGDKFYSVGSNWVDVISLDGTVTRSPKHPGASLAFFDSKPWLFRGTSSGSLTEYFSLETGVLGIPVPSWISSLSGVSRVLEIPSFQSQETWYKIIQGMTGKCMSSPSSSTEYFPEYIFRNEYYSGSGAGGYFGKCCLSFKGTHLGLLNESRQIPIPLEGSLLAGLWWEDSYWLLGLKEGEHVVLMKQK